MHVRLVVGPAGSGKTFCCLSEIRKSLIESPEGRPLLFVVPKQTTYQLERQLLADPELSGFARLQVLSFERLADFVFRQWPSATPEILDEDGRLMVLRALLARRRDSFKLFRASARLNGFAQQLSVLLREFQRNQVTPEMLEAIAEKSSTNGTLASKLHDLATILRDYIDWAKQQGWQDSDSWLTDAAKKLETAKVTSGSFPTIAGLLVDGFAEWSEQELELVVALIPHCEQVTLTFCLAELPKPRISWLSAWASIQSTFEKCRKRIAEVSQAEISIQILRREENRGRFAESPVLRLLEKFWNEPSLETASSEALASLREARSKSKTPGKQQLELGFRASGPPQPFEEHELGSDALHSEVNSALRIAKCADPETEATAAAHEVLAHVRSGGRYRDIAVLVRDLEKYHNTIQRVFARCEIPVFLDRREPVSHHPLAELTRNSIRTVAFDWRQSDWFAALKTGLLPAEAEEIDELENEALARGWKGRVWFEPLRMLEAPGKPQDTARLKELQQRLENLRKRVLPSFQRLAVTMGRHRFKPTGTELASAIRDLWNDLRVEETLQTWLDREHAKTSGPVPDSIHATVWDQMDRWLTNVELAFSGEGLSLRDWLPIIEAGLSNLSVGLIPPALDQVTIGTIERSRNPEVKLAIILGLNEGVFPATSTAGGLLTDGDRDELETYALPGNTTARRHLGRERFYAYLAFTRARKRLVLTYSIHDSNGKALNPSPFIGRLRGIFPSLEVESIAAERDWRKGQHPHEMVEPFLLMENYQRLIRSQNKRPDEVSARAIQNWQRLATLSTLRFVLEALRNFEHNPAGDSISPSIAARLYGGVLKTSVSRMEQFAACPFKFFVGSGLRAESREIFELDVKEQGSFQHDALAEFHLQLASEGKRWRDITPKEARERIAAITASMALTYRGGLFQATEQGRFVARNLGVDLQNFVETLLGWMGNQYGFDPVAVELPFGQDESSPAWEIELSQGRRLAVYGRIDRVDILRRAESDEGLCVVVDYKSSHRRLDPVLLAHGIQLQLLTYLNVLRSWQNPEELFKVRRLIPSGVFYVNLAGKFSGDTNRTKAFAGGEEARMLAYQHAGRFDAQFLRFLDARANATKGDQFNYRILKSGLPDKRSRDVMQTAEFISLLDSIEASLVTMGEEVFAGSAKIDPFQKGSAIACDHCDYRSICRIDPWTHSYRVLKQEDPD